MPPDVVYSTLSAPAISGLVAQHYDLGPIAACHLIKRGFNDVYVLTTATGPAGSPDCRICAPAGRRTSPMRPRSSPI